MSSGENLEAVVVHRELIPVSSRPILKPSPQADGQLRIGRFFARTLYARPVAGADVVIER